MGNIKNALKSSIIAQYSERYIFFHLFQVLKLTLYTCKFSTAFDSTCLLYACYTAN